MLNELTKPLLGKPSVILDRCAICGLPADNQHHVIQKGMGGTAWESMVPTITLCGRGNMSGHHGLAHTGQLFFRWEGEWQYLVCKSPTDYQGALGMDGWKPLPGLDDCEWTWA